MVWDAGTWARSGLIIGVLVERVSDVISDVFAGGGVDVDGGDGFGLGGGEVGGHGLVSFLGGIGFRCRIWRGG